MAADLDGIRRGRRSGWLAAACLAAALPASAATVVLDGASGAHYDSVGDGWFFAGPTSPPPDGVGDLGGQALAVGSVHAVLDLRAMAEFPLAPLAGVDPLDVAAATLTVTVDDVLSTFGPGADFDGTASETIAAYHYPADGTVTVADFFPAGLSQVGFVVPGAGLTDASLAASGPLAFHLDVTARLRAALAGGDGAFGILLGTLDTPTATSLDGLSPPGVPGGRLPFVTVVTGDDPGTTTSTSTPSTSSTTTSLAATTTSSTIETTSSTRTPTTSTTTPGATTTTLPAGCTAAPTIGSIRCRLEALESQVRAEPAVAGVATRLQAQIARALDLLDRAAAALETGDTREARSTLRRLGGRYRALGRPLRSLKGRRTIPDHVRRPLLAAVEGLAADSKALQRR